MNRSRLPFLALALAGPAIASALAEPKQPLSVRELTRLGKQRGLLKKLLDFADSPELPADPQEAHDRLASLLFQDDIEQFIEHSLYEERPDTWQAYGCPRCGKTYDRLLHYGVTPFTSLCYICGSLRTSAGIVHALPEKTVVFKEWYRPTPTEIVRILGRDLDQFQHIHLGGLDVRPTKDAPKHTANHRKPSRRSTFKTGRNQPCPCGSGRKFKHCCIGKTEPDET
jgi:hypothetical protein